VATGLMDSVGRRQLMIWSTVGMLLSTAFVLLALYGLVAKPIALVAVMGFVSFFEIGLGPIPWLISAEMFEAKYVASAQSMACQVNWACNFAVGVGFPFMNEALGNATFVPFGGVVFLCMLFVIFRMPETLHTSTSDVLHQARLMWGKKESILKARKLSVDSDYALEVFNHRIRRLSSVGNTDNAPIEF